MACYALCTESSISNVRNDAGYNRKDTSWPETKFIPFLLCIFLKIGKNKSLLLDLQVKSGVDTSLPPSGIERMFRMQDNVLRKGADFVFLTWHSQILLLLFWVKECHSNTD